MLSAAHFSLKSLVLVLKLFTFSGAHARAVMEFTADILTLEIKYYKPAFLICSMFSGILAHSAMDPATFIMTSSGWLCNKGTKDSQSLRPLNISQFSLSIATFHIAPVTPSNITTFSVNLMSLAKGSNPSCCRMSVLQISSSAQWKIAFAQCDTSS